MRLYTGPTTPFGRMVEVLAIEAGLELPREVVKVTEARFLDEANPLRLIPTLVDTPHGTIHDSRVICRYLASLSPDVGFYPAAADWRFETRLALISGIMDAGVARQGERSRPEASRSEAAIAVFERRLAKGIAALDRDFQAFADAWPRMDAIAAAVLLAYVDFRVGPRWREASPALAGWFAVAGERASMAATRFPAP